MSRDRAVGPKFRIPTAIALAGFVSAAALTTSDVAATQGASPTYASSPPVTQGGHSTIAQPYSDPWLAYRTAVDPGPAIQATDGVVWRLTGQGPTPHIDDELSAGPGAKYTWPGNAIQAPTDGGTSWSQIYNVTGGIWGIDLMNATTGWVVGVTSFAMTTDGGSTWTNESEPSAGKLVVVDFTSPTVGFGLTTQGRLVSTTDSGNSWANASLAGTGTSLCFSNPQTGNVAGANGSIWHTSSGGASWTSAGNPLLKAGSPIWTQLSCNGGNVIASQVAANAQGPATPSFLVDTSSDGGTTWTVGQSTNSSNTNQPTVQTRRTAPLATLGGVVAAGPSSDLLVGLPAIGLRIDALGITAGQPQSAAAAAPSMSTEPVPSNASHVPAPASAPASDYMTILGAAFASPSDGYIYVTEDALGSHSAPQYEDLVLATTDGGTSWSTVSESRPTTPPPLQYVGPNGTTVTPSGQPIGGPSGPTSSEPTNSSAASTQTSTHTCGSNWCSGSDGSTANNVQGNPDQIYIGEVGIYYTDENDGEGPCTGSGYSTGVCFSTSGANGALTRKNNGTGLGVQYYYFGGGATSQFAAQYGSPYCWGWQQGYFAESDLMNDFSGYLNQQVYIEMFLDIEGGNNVYGWDSADPANNREVFNGFTDFLAKRSPAQAGCVSHTQYYTIQYGAYSSPDNWSSYMQGYGTVGNTPIWTSESDQYPNPPSYPSSFSGAEFFGSSNYNPAWQFYSTPSGPDYDEYYEPQYLPVYGITWGS